MKSTISDEALQRRRLQNRIAQRKFRSKKWATASPKTTITAAPELLGKPIRPRIQPLAVANCRTASDDPFQHVDTGILSFPKPSRLQGHPTEKKGNSPQLTDHLLQIDLCSPADNTAISLKNGVDAAEMPTEVFQNMLFHDFLLPTTPKTPYHTSVTRVRSTRFLASSIIEESGAYSDEVFRTLVDVTRIDTPYVDHCDKAVLNSRSGVGDTQSLDFLSLDYQAQGDIACTEQCAWGPTPPLQPGDSSITSPTIDPEKTQKSAYSLITEAESSFTTTAAEDEADQEPVSDAEIDISGHGSYQSALHIAAQRGHEGLVDILLKCGVNTNELDGDLNTPLHRAVHHSRTLVVHKLLEHGADPNAVNSRGWTPVHIAVSVGSVEIVRLLVEYGGDVLKKARSDQS